MTCYVGIFGWFVPFAKSGCVSLVSHATAACGYLQSGRPPFLNGGLHLDFGGVLQQWSKLAENRMTQQDETKTTPN